MRVGRTYLVVGLYLSHAAWFTAAFVSEVAGRSSHERRNSCLKVTLGRGRAGLERQTE